MSGLPSAVTVICAAWIIASSIVWGAVWVAKAIHEVST